MKFLNSPYRRRKLTSMAAERFFEAQGQTVKCDPWEESGLKKREYLTL